MISAFAARIFCGRVAATPRLPRGHSVETRRGGAAAAAWTFRGDRRTLRLIKLLQKSDNNNAFTWTSELYEAACCCVKSAAGPERHGYRPRVVVCRRIERPISQQVFVMKDLGKKFVLLDPSDLDPQWCDARRSVTPPLARRSPGGFEIQFAPPHHKHGAALRIHNNFFVIQFPRVFLELDEAARSTLKKHSRSLISFFITKYREGKYGSGPGTYSEAVKASMLSCLYFVLAEATLPHLLPPDVEDLTS